MTDRYSFKSVDADGKAIDVYFEPETQSIREQLDLAYAKAFKFYFTNGVMTRAQALDIGRKNGVLDEKWEERMGQNMVDLADVTQALQKERDKKRKNKTKISELKDRMRDLRTEYNRLVDCQNDIVQATCEARSENRQIEMSIVLRTTNADGEFLFASHEDLVSRYGERLVSDALQHMVCLRAGIPYEAVDLFDDHAEK